MGRHSGTGTGKQNAGEDFTNVLVETGTLLASTLDLDEVFNHILAALKRIVDYDSASILICKGDVLEMRAVAGFSQPKRLEGFIIPLARYAINARIVGSAKPEIIDDVRKSPDWIIDDLSPEVKNIRAWMGVPLIASGKVLGILCMDSCHIAMYGPAQLSQAMAFATQAAMAIRNARLYGEADRRIRHLSVLNRVGQAVIGQTDINRLCHTVGELVHEIFNSGIVYIALLDEDRQLIDTPYFLLDEANVSFPPIKFGFGLTSLVLKSKEPLLVQKDAPRILAELGGIPRKERHPLSWLGVPIMLGSKAIGVLSVQDFNKEELYDADDVSLLETIASNIASALDAARAYEKAEKRSTETRTLLEIAKDVSSSLDLDAVPGTVVERACALLTRDTAAVYLVSEEDRSFSVVAASGLCAAELFMTPDSAGTETIRAVVESGSPKIINDPPENEQAEMVIEAREIQTSKKLMMTPLATGDRILGAMAIWRSLDEPDFSGADLEFCSALAGHAALALSNAQTYRQAMIAREEAERANRVKSQFLATMSHELRTPLNSVINFAYLLMEGIEGQVNSAQRELLCRIESAGKHLLKLINDILDLAKIESGHMELFFEDLDLHQVIIEAATVIRGLLHNRPVELRLEIEAELPLLRADRTRLHQVLMNLLANAVKFTEQGYITIRAQKVNTSVRVEVEDTGIGMKPEDISRAFQEFIQLDAGKNRRSGGTGLGLPITKRFVEMHGGSLHIQSQPDKGTVIGFSLPYSLPNI
ncbi:MAG: GAF domain-containing protein [Spirochaetes bacterium]|nr:GAF domain-containing protein [Spirochaetota bacterium]